MVEGPPVHTTSNLPTPSLKFRVFRLAMARFAHPGLLPVAHFGAKKDGFRGDA